MPIPSAYKRLKERGLCANCGSPSRPLIEGKLYCQICFDKREKRVIDRARRRKLHRDWQLKNWYGINADVYSRLYDNQKGICPICDKPLAPKEETRANCLDHNHKTGDVRGILHKGCNVLVGYAEHPLLLRALEYATAVYCDADFSGYRSTQDINQDNLILTVEALSSPLPTTKPTA